MKNKKLIIAAVVVAVVILGVILIRNNNILKGKAKKAVLQTNSSQTAPKAVAKKTFSKDMGGLTVKITDISKKDLNLGITAYKSADRRSSVYAAAFNSNRMQELTPSTYDIQIQSTPPMFYKGIAVAKGRETVEDLGALTGVLNIKLLNYKKKEANVPLRIQYQGSALTVASGSTNRPIQLVSGTYDIEIGTAPRQLKKDVKIESGKETLIDLGDQIGAIVIKTVDENNKEVRLNARIKKTDTGEVVASSATNRPTEVLKGIYNVELLSSPAQIKKDVAVEAGSESTVEFTVQAPPAKVQASQKITVKK